MTTKLEVGYTLVPYPVLRRFSIDAGYLGRRRHIMHGLLEFDVTLARRLMRAHKAETGESISFTAFLVYCLAKAIEANKEVHAYLDWRKRLVIYDDVNIATLVEVETDQGKVAIPRILQETNHKPVAEIQAEIRATQRVSLQTREAQFMRWFLLLPGFMRHLIESILMRNPRLFREYVCPVVVSAVGMFAKGGGWGIPMSNFTLNVVVGGITEKPGVVNGRIEIREYLCVTLSFDHDIIDGAPAARFTHQFRELVEQGHGLGEEKMEKSS